MNKENRIDARGLSCPQPALLASQAMEQAAKGELVVLVDSGTSRDNVTRNAQRLGWEVAEIVDEGDSFRLVLRK